jgi:hypothetical protein
MLASLLPFVAWLPPWLLVLEIALLLAIRWLLSWPHQNVKIQPMRASKFCPELVPSGKIDTIVVGSGSGGCACANMLSQAGQRVLILEQHPTTTGGCTHTFHEKKCEWDTGLHYVSLTIVDYRPTGTWVVVCISNNFSVFVDLGGNGKQDLSSWRPHEFYAQGTTALDATC